MLSLDMVVNFLYKLRCHRECDIMYIKMMEYLVKINVLDEARSYALPRLVVIEVIMHETKITSAPLRFVDRYHSVITGV